MVAKRKHRISKINCYNQQNESNGNTLPFATLLPSQCNSKKKKKKANDLMSFIKWEMIETA